MPVMPWYLKIRTQCRHPVIHAIPWSCFSSAGSSACQDQVPSSNQMHWKSHPCYAKIHIADMAKITMFGQILDFYGPEEFRFSIAVAPTQIHWEICPAPVGCCPAPSPPDSRLLAADPRAISWTPAANPSHGRHGRHGCQCLGYPLVMTNVAIENDHL